MEYIILVLIIFIFINTILKLSYWKWWQRVIFGFICGAFVLLAYPYAISQSKTELAACLNNSKVMQDMAVLITMESILFIAFCFPAMRQLYGRASKRWVILLYWYPGILVFPALFYVLTNMMFSFPGIAFLTIAYILAGGIFVLLPLLSAGINRLLPEKELRLEMQFLISLFVTVTGLISTENGNTVYAAVSEPLDIKALLVAIWIFLAFFVTGYGWNKIKWRFRKTNL
jgi:hypothetical protein